MRVQDLGLRTSGRRARLFAAAAGLVLAGAASGASAGEEGPQSTSLTEVVVTANKRGAALAQDLPETLTAFNADKIDQLRAVGLDDLILQTPGANFINSGGPGRGYKVASIRGLSPVGDNTTGVVAQYLDGAPHFVPNYYLFDVGEVSVLRGPQGTLWGSQAIGGLVSIRSNRPDTSQISGELRSDTYGTAESHGLSQRFAGTVNLPLIEDKLGLRLAAQSIDERGYIDNAVTGARDMNGVRDYAVRASLLYRPSDRVELTFIYQGDRLKTGAPNYFDLTREGLQTSSPFSSSPGRLDADLFNLLGDVDLGWATLSYAGSHFSMDNRYLTYRRGVFGLAPVARETVTDHQSAWTHELRLASKGESRLGWVVGLYYDKLDDDNLISTIEVKEPGNSKSPAFFEGFPLSALGGPNNTTDKAIFGELTYDVTDKLQVLVGGRYFQWEVENRQQTTYFGSNLAKVTGTVSGDKAFYKIQVNYRPTEDITLYALRSEGFRPGGFNPFVGPTLNIPERFVSFEPDTLINYEAGAKTSWLDRRLHVNAAVYFMDWRRIQTVVFNSTGNFAFTTNGPDLEAKGGELEVTAQDVGLEGLYMSAAYSYTTNEFASDAAIFPGVRALIHKGDKLRRTIPGAWSLDVGYDFTLMQDYDAFVRANYWHKDATTTKSYDSNDGNIRVPAQDVFNVQAGVSRDGVTVRLYVNNLTNERPLQQIFPNANNPAQPAIASTIRPRTIGLELAKTF